MTTNKVFFLASGTESHAHGVRVVDSFLVYPIPFNTMEFWIDSLLKNQLDSFSCLIYQSSRELSQHIDWVQIKRGIWFCHFHFGNYIQCRQFLAEITESCSKFIHHTNYSGILLNYLYAKNYVDAIFTAVVNIMLRGVHWVTEGCLSVICSPV